MRINENIGQRGNAFLPQSVAFVGRAPDSNENGVAVAGDPKEPITSRRSVLRRTPLDKGKTD